jgi:hypothetical protein
MRKNLHQHQKNQNSKRKTITTEIKVDDMELWEQTFHELTIPNISRLEAIL